MVWGAHNEVEVAAIQSLQHDSDRSVGIVAAAFVEGRLEEMIQSYLYKDENVIP